MNVKKVKLLIIIGGVIGIIIIVLFMLNYLNNNKKLGIENYSWKRINSYGEEEVLYFGTNKQFLYYYPSSGNKVNKYALCDKYKYNNITKSIELKCNDYNKRIIKIIEISDNYLHIMNNENELYFR